MAGLLRDLPEGVKLVCVDIHPENANQCAAAIAKHGGQAIGVVCDVTNEEQVKATVEREVAYGGVDILVNSAVIFNQKGVLDMSLAEWTDQTSIILTGTFLFTKYVAQQMIDQKSARETSSTSSQLLAIRDNRAMSATVRERVGY